MNKYRIILATLLSAIGGDLPAQTERDTIERLQEVRVVGKANQKIETPMKMAVSVDEFLASSAQISFIKRGAYAWEPLLNNLSSERSTLTIDGMHIFGACTDKMDPITSYVESNNLSSIEITSGQEGSLNGATVGGSIDLRKKRTPFGLKKTWSGTYQTGFEFNNNQFFHLGNIAYSGEKLAADGSVSFRKAGNYFDGNGEEVHHSQYDKFNTSLAVAYKTSPSSSLHVDAILDVAKDVGFPALPMDLWLSRALIASASYKQHFQEGMVQSWETKAYYNAVEHYMDDTTRPENLVHMDMPGWSTTYGLISKLNFVRGNVQSIVQLNAYDNLSIAEMRMYPQDRSERSMFAYSWPWVTTRYGGLSIYNIWELTESGQLHFGGALGVNYNQAKYIEFNWIFHPGASAEKKRILPALHARYEQQAGSFEFTVGGGYGHRAPSVSEGYGYYIYNSFDRYDYIGNPDLQNEISYEINGSIGFNVNRVGITAQINYFHIQNYIVGKILGMGSPMNYQSVGVKGYTALNYATLFNFAVNARYDILEHLHWNGALTYARARRSQGGNLPFIRPWSYHTSLHWMRGKWGVQAGVQGDTKQVDFSPEYGEDQTPAYSVWNLSADYTWQMGDKQLSIQTGVENLMNSRYSTYADWGNIPRMGRNVFTALKINF